MSVIEKVREALENARANGYGMSNYSDANLARELSKHDSYLENIRLADIISAVYIIRNEPMEIDDNILDTNDVKVLNLYLAKYVDAPEDREVEVLEDLCTFIEEKFKETYGELLEAQGGPTLEPFANDLKLAETFYPSSPDQEIQAMEICWETLKRRSENGTDFNSNSVERIVRWLTSRAGLDL